MKKILFPGRSVFVHLLVCVLLLGFSWVYPIYSSTGTIYLQSHDLLVAPVIAPDPEATPAKSNPITQQFSAPLFLPLSQSSHFLTVSIGQVSLQYDLGRIPPSLAYPTPFQPRSPPSGHTFEI
ncbi:MAG: hypothetical protein GXY54_07995 [Deltaproteobacteria bacterium]|nr:hypothetical protein [Deltaproteobacteria bacterium]